MPGQPELAAGLAAARAGRYPGWRHRAAGPALAGVGWTAQGAAPQGADRPGGPGQPGSGLRARHRKAPCPGGKHPCLAGKDLGPAGKDLGPAGIATAAAAAADLSHRVRRDGARRPLARCRAVIASPGSGPPGPPQARSACRRQPLPSSRRQKGSPSPSPAPRQPDGQPWPAAHQPEPGADCQGRDCCRAPDAQVAARGGRLRLAGPWPGQGGARGARPGPPHRADEARPDAAASCVAPQACRRRCRSRQPAGNAGQQRR
jgi:hypothetical protein